MTPEEAIKTIELAKAEVEWEYPMDYAVAFEKAKEALEKQIPKKPYDVDTECKTFDCPACLSKLYADEDVRDCTYCCVCGQALDWGSEEE